MEEEIRAGVDFFLTTSVFELNIFENFIRKIEYLKVPIIAGIMILKSVGMARFMNKHVEDVFVPEVLIEKLMKSADKPKTSVEIASELINGLKPLCQGVHLIPFGWEDKVPSIIEKAGLY
jgi:5,10-methylenetetrahydrofolate reductase